MACVKLTDRYVTDRAFPDKAIDAMDEVGARVHLQHAQMPPEIGEKEKEISYVKEKKQAAVRNQNFELAASYRDKQTELEAELQELQDKWANNEIGKRDIITEKDVADVVSMITGVPVQRMAEAEGVRLKNMGAELKKAVIAQDKAIEKMVKAIQRNRVGLKEPNHPIGAFMFLGPTGVGKTYLAKKLAEYMFGSSDALIRIDMSEYSESFNTSRLMREASLQNVCAATPTPSCCSTKSRRLTATCSTCCCKCSMKGVLLTETGVLLTSATR